MERPKGILKASTPVLARADIRLLGADKKKVHFDTSASASRVGRPRRKQKRKPLGKNVQSFSRLTLIPSSQAVNSDFRNYTSK